MKINRREIVGFAISPLSTYLFFQAYGLLSVLFPGVIIQEKFTDAAGFVAAAAIDGLIFSYMAQLVIFIPVYLLLKFRGKNTFAKVMMLGAAIGILFALYVYPRNAPFGLVAFMIPAITFWIIARPNGGNGTGS